MFKTKWTIALGLAVCALLLPTTVWAKAKKTYFTGTEYALAELDPGTFLTDGQTLFGMGRITQTDEDLTDPRAKGVGTVGGNGVMNLADWTGWMWGDFHVENGGGEWDGYWVAEVGMGIRITATLVGSGGYDGLVMYWYGTPGDGGIAVTGYIVEAKGGPGDRPLQVKESRVDRLELHPCMVFPPSDPPEYGIIGRVDILSGVGEASHLGRCTNQGVGLLDPLTGAVSAMGTVTTANKDEVYWVAVGTTNLSTSVFDGALYWAGGTGLFEAAVGGVSALFEMDMEPIDDQVFLANYRYKASGTIRY